MTATPRRLLVVDADPVLRRIQEEELGRAGFRVLTAADAEEAWRRFVAERPDLVVTELILPGTPGFALCRRIKASADPLPVPVILQSVGNKDVRGDSDALLRFGADGWIEKPVSTDRLSFRVRELLDGRIAGPVGADRRPVATRPPFLLDPQVPFHQGELAERDVASLLASFCVGRRSGKVVAMRRSEVRQVWFRRGHPVFAESNVEGEELGQILLGRRAVRADALAAAREEWAGVDRSLGVVLVSRGDLGAATLFRAMRDNVERVLLGLFGWSDGTYYLEYADDAPPPEVVSLNRAPEHYFVQGVRRGYGDDRCASVLRAVAGPLVASPDAAAIVRELPDPHPLLGLLAGLAEPRPLAEVLAGPLPPGSIQDLVALRAFGAILEVREPRRAAARVPSPPPVPAAAPATPNPPPPRPPPRPVPTPAHRAERRADILGALEAVSSTVHFENGRRLVEEGDFPGAVAELEEAVRLAPLQAGYHEALGRAHLAAGGGEDRAALAVEALERAARLDPQLASAWHGLGVGLARLGRLPAAEEALRKAVALGGPLKQESERLLATLRR
ncbi:response regulator [Myxococcota bacterium]|nr:response regulator [Myxococcota bacterium]